MTLRSGARSPRRERVGEQLREEISAMMITEIKDPRVRLASISRVRMSPDLREAWLDVSAFGDDAERHNVVEALGHAEGFLRGQLGRRLENLRSIPRLHFELDESISYSVRVSTLLRDLAVDRPDEAPVEVPE
jgi:ribosome-binding factor A